MMRPMMMVLIELVVVVVVFWPDRQTNRLLKKINKK